MAQPPAAPSSGYTMGFSPPPEISLLSEYERARVRDLEVRTALRVLTVKVLLGLFSTTVLVALFLFVANAFEWTRLSDAGLASLAGVTIVEVAGLLYIVVRELFSAPAD